MIRWLAFHWHRFHEGRHHSLALRLFAAGRLHHDAARAHGAQADEIRPPREWPIRLWQRDHDPRSDNRERRP